MAVLLGGDIKDATWFNPEIASAEANRINIESAHQQATYELQERLANAQTEAEIQRIQREQKLQNAQFEHDIQALTQDLEHRDMAFKAWMTVAIIVGSALSIALIVGMILWVGSKALVNIRRANAIVQSASTLIPQINPIQSVPERDPYDPWRSKKYRRAMIKAARYRECASRKAELGKGRDNMPLAG